MEKLHIASAFEASSKCINDIKERPEDFLKINFRRCLN